MLKDTISIKGVPLRGGAITVRSKALLKPGEFSMVQNLRGFWPGFEKRAGQAKKHTTADGTNQVVSIYQFKKTRPAEDHVFALMSDGDILEATDLPPTVTTGVFGAEFWSGTTSPQPPSWSNVNDMMLFANGVDQHHIYPGDSSNVRKFIVYNGSSIATTLLGVIEEGFDYTEQVTDGQSSTVAILDSLPIGAQNGAIFICTSVPASSVTLTVSAANSVPSGLVGYYWANDSTWTALSGFTDGTASGGATLAQSGTVSWTEPTDIQDKYLFGTPGYWYMFVVGDFTSAVDLTGYSETDSGSDITVAANLITVDTMAISAVSHVEKSYGSGYFGNFRARFKINYTANTNQTGTASTCWAISNTYFTVQDMTDNNDGIRVGLSRTAGDDYQAYVKDETTDNTDTSVMSNGTAPGERWLEVERNGTTLTVKIYTDAFSTLADTMTITCGVQTYAYHVAVASRDSADANTITFTTSDYQFLQPLDSEVEISAATFDASMTEVKNIWDGVFIPSAEVLVEGTTQFETYGATSVDLDSLASGKKIYIASTDPLEGIYIDAGETPNATGTALTSLKYWDGDSWVSVGTVVDGTSGMSNSGWITFPRQSDVQPLHFESSSHYSYWYELIWDSQISADVVVGIYTMPYFTMSDFGYVGRVSAAWKNRGVYAFKDKFQEYIYISAYGNPQALNGSDYTILEMGDGRAHEIVAMKKFYNELMVWQEEKGTEGGTLTLVQGYNVATFGKLLLSARLGTYSQKTVDVIENFRTSTASGAPVVKAVAFALSRYGVYMCDGTSITFISDDIANYFDPTKTECIRHGYGDQHWLKYDPAYNIIRVGIVSGTSATTPNVFFAFDLTDLVWYVDVLAQELSCMENVDAASGNTPTLQLGGGVDDGTVYILNTGTNDVSTAIDSYIQVELPSGGQWWLLFWLMLQVKAQSAGTITITTYQNGIQKDQFTLAQTAEIANQDARRHLKSLNVKDPVISIRIEHNTVSESAEFQNIGMEVKTWENR